jgi:uncharacterized protein YjbJ (UPF0337 family)
MNRERIEGNWNQLKGSIKETWGKLTDDEYEMIAGARAKLVGTLQERYGYSRGRAEAEVDRWEREFPDEPRH